MLNNNTVFIQPLSHCNDITQHRQTVAQDSTTEWLFTQSIYIAPCLAYRALRHGSHSFYLQTTPCLPFVCKRSPDGATANWGSSHPYMHPIAAYYSFIDPKGMKGWVGLVGWPIADGLPT